jgi:lipopolysaccharide export system protein LptC
MKSKLYQMLLVAALAVISLLCWNVYAQEKQSGKVVWEYNVASFVGDNTYQLSQLGVQGWELTSVRSEEEMVGNFRQTKVYYYLKRAKQIQK